MKLLLASTAEWRSRLEWLAVELARQAGSSLRPVWSEAASAELRLGERRMEHAELEGLWRRLSLEAEQDGPLDGFGRFDERHAPQDLDRPWITERAREFFGEAAGTPEFHVFFTHDVDRTTGLEATSLVKAALQTLARRGSNWLSLGAALDHGRMNRRLRELLELESAEGVRGIYFMISGPAGLGRYDSRTDIRWRSALRAARMIREHGGVIGLHGSFHVREERGYAQEARRIRQATGEAVLLQRNHYLRLDTRRFCGQLEDAGIRLDCSLGFTRRMGYRTGVSGLWRPWNLEQERPAAIAALPLVYMEAPGQQKDPEPVLRELEQVLRPAAQAGGALTLLVHPEVFAVDRRWYDMYRELIRLCRGLGARLDTDPLEFLNKKLEEPGHGG